MDNSKPKLKVHFKPKQHALKHNMLNKKIETEMETIDQLEKPKFSCSYCDKGFASKYSLQRHLDQACTQNLKSTIIKLIHKLEKIEEVEEIAMYTQARRNYLIQMNHLSMAQNSQQNQMVGNQNINHVMGDKNLVVNLNVMNVGDNSDSLIENRQFQDKVVKTVANFAETTQSNKNVNKVEEKLNQTFADFKQNSESQVYNITFKN